ncbi:PREDICTED: cysteine-rich [Prunus dulcis]|uniref:PREDICTED: cysteine-rich n=1 Tax=Prunus dulcis TaxID=3755 RepID=A0A5E4GBU5_PRUDU|nr:PREDICTED: cysteine-rich [Prunus dulcis]
MAPEYVMHGQFYVKSIVYSFGVLILEIAWKSWREGTASNLIDPTLRTGSRSEIMRCIHIGLLCVQENVADRPTHGFCYCDTPSVSLCPHSQHFFCSTSLNSTCLWDRRAIPGGDDTDEIRFAKFDSATIRVSTDDFFEANKLGEDGFGSVYRGRLFNGEDIAVKRLSTNSGHGDLELKNEWVYMALEYAFHGRLFSVKSDVYSFGALVLEIVNGQKISCFQHGDNVDGLLSFAWRSWREGTASNLIDPTLKTDSRNEIMRCIHIGLLCVQENVADRPTMASVNIMTNSYSLTLPVPSQPAFYLHSSIGLDMSLRSEYNSGATRSDRSKSNSVNVMEYETFTEPHPR